MLTYLLWLFIAISAVLTAVVVTRVFLGRHGVNAVTAHRGLFVYSDGIRRKSIDPIAAYLGLEGHPEFRLDRHPKLSAEGDIDAVELTARAVREVFEVPAFTVAGKPGLTVTECHRLLRAFVLYVESQKKSISPLQTAAPSTDATSQGSSEPTTSDSSPSGSVASVPE